MKLSKWLEQQQPSPNHLEPGNWRLCLGSSDRDELIAGVRSLEDEIERLREMVEALDGLCKKCGRHPLKHDAPDPLETWWECGICLNSRVLKATRSHSGETDKE